MLANIEILRRAIEHKTVPEAVKKLTDAKVDPEWIKSALAELGYKESADE